MSGNALHSASACLIVGAQKMVTLFVILVVILGEKAECKSRGRQQQVAGSLGSLDSSTRVLANFPFP